MSKEVELKIKEEIEKLLKAKFIRSTMFVQWLTNIVPIMKKNGKLWVYVNCRDLNVVQWLTNIVPITNIIIFIYMYV